MQVGARSRGSSARRAPDGLQQSHKSPLIGLVSKRASGVLLDQQDTNEQDLGNRHSDCSLADFEIKAILGQGSSGTVYKAYQKYRDPNTGQKTLHRVVALKEVKMKDTISKKAYKEVMNEVEMMKRITHPNIIQLYDSFIDRQFDTAAFRARLEKQSGQQSGYPSNGQNREESMNSRQTEGEPHGAAAGRDGGRGRGAQAPRERKEAGTKTKASGTSMYIAMEFAEQGDMQTLINQQKSKRKYFSEKEIWQVAWQLSLALLHCHSHDIIHRDIKPLNVLITKDRQIKLGDLSESTIVNKETYLNTKQVGTPLYLSPEMIKKQAYDHRSDIFSLGVVMYHMAALEVPFNDKTFQGLMSKILYKQPLPFQVAYSQDLKDFIFGLLEKDKSKRAFIIDLFPCFPSNYFKIANEVDQENFDAYSLYKDAMDRKRAIDGNKHRIQEQFDILKKRFKDDIQEQKQKRADNSKKISLAYVDRAKDSYDAIEKEELLKQRRRQIAANAANKKRDEAILGPKAARAGVNDSLDNVAQYREGSVLNRENLSRLDEMTNHNRQSQRDQRREEMPNSRQYQLQQLARTEFQKLDSGRIGTQAIGAGLAGGMKGPYDDEIWQLVEAAEQQFREPDSPQEGELGDGGVEGDLLNFRFGEANSSSVSPPKKSYGNKGSNLSALKTHKHLTAQKSKAKFGISAFNDKKLIAQKPSFLVAYGLDPPAADPNQVSALISQTGKIPQREHLEKAASAVLAEEAMASFQRTPGLIHRATPSITEETPKKKQEKYQEDNQQVPSKYDSKSPMLRIRNSLTDSNAEDKQIAFKKQKMSVATLPNRQGEYGYAEASISQHNSTPGVARETQSKMKEKDIDQEVHLWIGGPGPARPGMSGRKKAPMIMPNNVIVVGSSFPDFPSPGRQRPGMAEELKQFQTPRSRGEGAQRPHGEGRRHPVALDIEVVTGQRGDYERLDAAGRKAEPLFREDGCPEIKSPASRKHDALITESPLKRRRDVTPIPNQRSQDVAPPLLPRNGKGEKSIQSEKKPINHAIPDHSFMQPSVTTLRQNQYVPLKKGNPFESQRIGDRNDQLQSQALTESMSQANNTHSNFNASNLELPLIHSSHKKNSERLSKDAPSSLQKQNRFPADKMKQDTFQYSKRRDDLLEHSPLQTSNKFDNKLASFYNPSTKVQLSPLRILQVRNDDYQAAGATPAPEETPKLLQTPQKHTNGLQKRLGDEDTRQKKAALQQTVKVNLQPHLQNESQRDSGYHLGARVGGSAQRGWPQNGHGGTVAATSKVIQQQLKAKSTTRSGLTIHHLRHVSDKKATEAEAEAQQNTQDLLSNVDQHEGLQPQSITQSANLHTLQRPAGAARNPAQFEAFRHLISNSSSNMALATGGGTSPGIHQPLHPGLHDNSSSQPRVRQVDRKQIQAQSHDITKLTKKYS